jgi:DNA-binding MarR family transcriptional regulator
MNKSTIEAWLALQQSLRAIQSAAADSRWLSVDLTMAQLKTALLLVESGGLPSRIIGERLAIGASAVTPLVDRLVEHALARREPDPADRRVVYVRPTAKAVALQEALLQTRRAILEDVLDEVPEAERQGVKRALSVLRDSAARVRAQRHEETRTR